MLAGRLHSISYFRKAAGLLAPSNPARLNQCFSSIAAVNRTVSRKNMAIHATQVFSTAADKTAPGSEVKSGSADEVDQAGGNEASKGNAVTRYDEDENDDYEPKTAKEKVF
jgi:hypothetical protein